jgi:WD40 repeat protein
MNINMIRRLVKLAPCPFLLILIIVFTPIHAKPPVPNTGGNVEWSPDGSELAVIANNGVFIYDRNFQLLRYREASFPTYLNFKIWSPDGTKLLILNQIWRANTLDTILEIQSTPRGWIAGGEQVFNITSDSIQIRNASDGNISSKIPLTFQIEEALQSPDGTKIATSVGYGLIVFDLLNGGQISHLDQRRYGVGNYTWSPDSTQLAYAGTVPTSDGQSRAAIINIVDVKSGVVLRSSQPFDDSFSLAWSNHAPFLAGLSRSGVVYIWDTNTLNLLNTISVSGQITGNMDFSPFGGVVAVGVNPNPSTNRPLNASQPISENIPKGIVQNLADGAVSLVIPTASTGYLKAISDACDISPVSKKSLTNAIATNDISGLVSQITALPNSAIPTGCKADLLAVAQALQAK